MRIVVAECTVDYDGRLTAHLPMATRLVMVKADGCVAVHADGGAYKPTLKGTAGPTRGVPIAGTHSPSVGPNYRDFPATIHTVPRVSIHGVGRRSLGHEPGAVKGQMVPWGEVRPRGHAPRNIFTDQFE